MWISLRPCLLASFLSFCQAIHIIPNVDPPRNYSRPGERLELKCVSAGAKKLDWKVTQIPDEKNVTTPIPEESQDANRDLTSTLIFAPIRANQGGKYTCSDGTNKADFQLNVLDSASLYAPFIPTFNGTSEATLKCYQRFDPPAEIIWFRGDQQLFSSNIVDKANKSILIKANEGTSSLILSGENRYPARTGDYTCRLNTSNLDASLPQDVLTELGQLERTVRYEATPDVKIQGAGKSKSAIKGEDFTLNCTVQGHDHEDDRVKWTVKRPDADETVLVDSEWKNLNRCAGSDDAEHANKKCVSDASDIHFSRDRDFETYTSSSNHSSGVPQDFMSSLLQIKVVKEEHGGDYCCIASNTQGANRACVIVRVKDRLAALWPFIGIVAEVILLCAVIFICERRRSKTVEEEDETEPMKGDALENRDSTVRSRKQ